MTHRRSLVQINYLCDHLQLITLLIGPNDFCLDMCYQKHPEDIIKNHERDLLAVFRTIRDNIERTMLNVLVPPCKVFSFITNYLLLIILCSLKLWKFSSISRENQTSAKQFITLSVHASLDSDLIKILKDTSRLWKIGNKRLLKWQTEKSFIIELYVAKYFFSCFKVF